MKFIEKCPSTWEELQDLVAQLLNQAGYHAVSPCTIDTVRGTVEVDVFIESPDVFVKTIICECKFWKTPVTKEKVHAFRTVVHDSGAALGLLISRVGFQSGAVEAAKLSNVRLLTWEEFTDQIAERWIITQLRHLKKYSEPISVYTAPLDFPYERLKESDRKPYLNACKKYRPIRDTCWRITKNDLISAGPPMEKWYKFDEFTSIEAYLSYLHNCVAEALPIFENILKNSDIEIPAEKFDKLEGYTYMFLNSF